MCVCVCVCVFLVAFCLLVGCFVLVLVCLFCFALGSKRYATPPPPPPPKKKKKKKKRRKNSSLCFPIKARVCCCSIDIYSHSTRLRHRHHHHHRRHQKGRCTIMVICIPAVLRNTNIGSPSSALSFKTHVNKMPWSRQPVMQNTCTQDDESLTSAPSDPASLSTCFSSELVFVQLTSNRPSTPTARFQRGRPH